MNKRYVLPGFALAVFAAIASPIAHAGDNCEVGAKMPDGTVCAGISTGTGGNLLVTPKDAPGTYDWNKGKTYCEDLVAHGHDDWSLPTDRVLNWLYKNKDTGSFGGTFNGSGSDPYGLYWSGTADPDDRDVARFQYFDDGYRDAGYKDGAHARVRCVRDDALRP